jgi:hypothetical protein
LAKAGTDEMALAVNMLIPSVITTIRQVHLAMF